jgi:hypothetical protein
VIGVTIGELAFSYWIARARRRRYTVRSPFTKGPDVKIRVVAREGAQGFHLEDEDTGEPLGTLKAELDLKGNPKVDSMTRFQNAKLVVDGKSLKRLQRLSV